MQKFDTIFHRVFHRAVNRHGGEEVLREKVGNRYVGSSIDAG